MGAYAEGQVTHEQAMALLDRVRDGALYPAHVVNFALMMTGDLIDYGDETETALREMSAGAPAGGWGRDVPHQVGVCSMLDKTGHRL